MHSIPAARQVLDLLTRLQALQGDPQPDDRVFAGVEGPTMDGAALYRRYRELQTVAGVRSLRFHDLRHTFGTQAIASGAHVMDVTESMGHRHLSTTMRYVHHQPRHEAAARLGRQFTGAASELDALLGEGDPRDRTARLTPWTRLGTTRINTVRRLFVVAGWRGGPWARSLHVALSLASGRQQRQDNVVPRSRKLAPSGLTASPPDYISMPPLTAHTCPVM